MILEEVTIPISKKDRLYLDFYIPVLGTAVEVHGEQHFKFVPFFHGTAYGFLQHRQRDAQKIQWCELNNIQVISLNYNESIEEWRDKFNEEHI
jgi:hypothetical protein